MLVLAPRSAADAGTGDEEQDDSVSDAIRPRADCPTDGKSSADAVNDDEDCGTDVAPHWAPTPIFDWQKQQRKGGSQRCGGTWRRRQRGDRTRAMTATRTSTAGELVEE